MKFLWNFRSKKFPVWIVYTVWLSCHSVYTCSCSASASVSAATKPAWLYTDARMHAHCVRMTVASWMQFTSTVTACNIYMHTYTRILWCRQFVQMLKYCVRTFSNHIRRMCALSLVCEQAKTSDSYSVIVRLTMTGDSRQIPRIFFDNSMDAKVCIQLIIAYMANWPQ